MTAPTAGGSAADPIQETVAPGALGASSHWAQRYPPLLAFGVALLIALVVLPSALNLPQTNPTETLEYAPVPPDDNVDTPPPGNLSALGLPSSTGIEGDGAPGGNDAEPPPLPDVGIGTNPTTKRCVGNPPRQTEDPLAPPCVAFFEGDNFGSTYQGVTREEVRLLVYIEGNLDYVSGSSRTNRVAPGGRYYDLGQPPKAGEDEHLTVKGVRGWQRYFNDRFQTYGRRVHFYVYFASCGQSCTPESRRADAADNFLRIKPFAVVSFAKFGAEDDYLFSMAQKGVLNFGAVAMRPSKLFNDYPKLIWGYLPSVEQTVETYVTYVCQKLVPTPAALNGDTDTTPGGDAGKPRRFGLVATSDENWPGLLLAAELVKKRVTECGGEIVAEGYHPQCCLAQDNGDRGTYADAAMGDFKDKGVTTVLWPGGINDKWGRAAVTIGYQPEWVLLGDNAMDGNNPIRLSQNGTAFDGRAVMVTPQVFQPALEQQRCFQAYREADPDLPRADLSYVCEYYPNLFQFFVGVQVAGPRLGPTSVDKGFHAIPQHPSGDREVPACFYLPGDYTCVKDAQAEVWRNAGQAPGDSRNGCWASIDNGARSLPGRWAQGNVVLTGDEPCNAFSTSVPYNPTPL